MNYYLLDVIDNANSFDWNNLASSFDGHR